MANPDVSHSTADATETEVAQRSDDLPSETQVNKEVESGHVSPSQALACPFIGALAIASDETVSNLNACGYSPQIISFLQAHNRPMQHHSLNAVVLLDQDSPVPRQPAYLLAILIHPAKLNPKKVLVDLIMTQTKNTEEREDETIPVEPSEVVVQEDSEDENDLKEVPFPISPLEQTPAVSEVEVNDFLRNEVAPDLDNHPTVSKYMNFSP